jgi:predicted transcriptional regulator
MTHALENLETTHKVKLSVPLVASYLARGIKRTQIAKLCNISAAAVYDYCDRHYEELAPLIDTSDGIMAMKSKHIAEKAQERILKHLKDSEKKDLFALNAISGTHIDKMRLLSDKSTQNINMETLNASSQELKIRREELLSRLSTLKRGDNPQSELIEAE